VDPEVTSIARQRLGKQVAAATDTQATIEELLSTMFSIRPVQSDYREEFRNFKRAVSRELSPARKAEKMALSVQLAVILL
jgi:hypothetical protein